MTRAMRRMRKYLIVVACIALVAGVAIGGTMAWLSAKTQTVTNTFTVGNIDITLEETPNTDTDKDGENDAWTGHIIPGVDLPKDPKVTVKAGSEACYVFVKVEPVDWPNNANIKWTIDSDWKQLCVYENGVVTETPVENIYYIKQSEIPATDEDVIYDVLLNNKVEVSGELTKHEVDQIIADLTGTDGKVGSFTLNITAYAIQQEKMDNEYVAWQNIETEDAAWYSNADNDVVSPYSNQPTPTPAP